MPFLADSGIVRLCGDEIYVARPYGIQPTVTVYNRAGEQVRTIPVPAEVRHFVSYVVSPDGRIAFLDNESDAIYFVDRTGKYLKTVRMREVPDSGLQNCDGVVAGNKLIVSEDGSKRLLAIDLDVYEATIFRDLRQLPGSWLGSITFAAGKFYVCTPNQVFSFSPDDPTEHHVATLPDGIFNTAGIAHQAGRLFVVANKAGVVYEIDLASGNTKLIADGLQDPRGIVVLPVVADTGGQFTNSPARAPDPGAISVETFLERPFTGKPEFVIPPERLTLPEDMQACGENLREIDAAIQKYRKDHGQPPDWLSDLVPNYVSQETLLCPKDPAHSSLSAPDPKLPCSYSWQLSSASSPFLENPISYRTFKERQVLVYGGVVPMVRCMHHGGTRILNLSLDGQIYWAALTWERLFRPDPSSGAERRGPTTPQAASGRPPDLVARPSSASLAAASGKPESTVTALSSYEYIFPGYRLVGWCRSSQDEVWM